VNKQLPAFALAVILIAGIAAAVLHAGQHPPVRKAETAAVGEGKLSSVQIEVGPFDIHRKYRSMEGPYTSEEVRLADLFAAKKVDVPESKIEYVEGGNNPSMAATVTAGGGLPRSHEKPALYWVKGIKLVVLDENGKSLPTAEFICHLNVDVDPRSKVFDSAESTGNTRLFTLTQGQTEFHFPEGYAVPASSNEKWVFTFQAANRTTSEHRRIKHLCTVDFIKDSDLNKPMTALNWYAPYIAVLISDKEAKKLNEHHGPNCLATSTGTHAPNMVPGSSLHDSQHRVLNGHWAIPPGEHSYTAPITDERDLGFNSKDRIVHAVWTHIHPLCSQTTLSICDGAKTQPVFTVNSKTSTEKGLELTHIDNLVSEKGIVLPAGKHYQLSATYKNTTGKTQDSMVVTGIFFEDKKFVKPDWNHMPIASGSSSNAQTAAASSDSNDYQGTDVYPVFSAKDDGPLLKTSKTLELNTSAGKLHLVLDPSIAPQHATQLYKLFTESGFDGTTIFRYQPGFILQIASADMKREPSMTMSEDAEGDLRRLPLETASQQYGRGLHKKYALTMARCGADDSAVSSFSILLEDAPHLDHHFTVFGYAAQDKVTMDTIEKITSKWSDKLPYIVSAKDVAGGKSMLASSETSSEDGQTCSKKSLYCGIKPAETQEAKTCSKEPLYCGIKPAKKELDPSAAQNFALFNVKTDGPVLGKDKRVVMQTSAGNIHMVLEPALAPDNATQMYRLFKSGVFDGTPFSRLEPNFVLQTAIAQTKDNGCPPMPERERKLLRRLPLEVDQQRDGKGLHRKWVLSMAHDNGDPNSAVTSFSILLGDAPHLDHNYTVFGRVLDDAETKRTIEKITTQWHANHPRIIRITDSDVSIATR
jgi:cyclophilin family peptidyl-prolyl cis-trans isomerase